MRMGGMVLPAGNRDDLPFNHYEYTSLQLAEDKRRIQNEKMGRGQYFQAEPNFKEHCPKNDRKATGKFHKEREPCKSCSDDSFARKTHRKHLHVDKRREKSHHSSSASRDKVTRHSDKSNDGFPLSISVGEKVINTAVGTQESATNVILLWITIKFLIVNVELIVMKEALN